VVSSVEIYALRLEIAERQISLLPDPDPKKTPPIGAKKISPGHNQEPPGRVERRPNKVRDLRGFWSEMNVLLDTLIGAKSPGRHDIDSVKDKIDTLHGRGVLDRSFSRALHEIAVVTALATERTALPVDSHSTLNKSVHKILDRLAELQKLTARRFEHHVLDTLNRNSPSDWSIQLDVRIRDGQFLPEASDGESEEVSARVDTLITNSREQGVVVEVRSRIESIRDEQLESLKDWLNMVPPDVAVIIIIPDGDLRKEHLSQDRRRRLRVLDWDTRSNLLMSAIHESFMAPTLLRQESRN